jgi:hypothetical protein
MPRVNVGNRTVHAICLHFAEQPKFELDGLCIATAVKSKLPEAEVVHGTMEGTDGTVPYTWVCLDGRDYDVQFFAQRHRSRLAHCLKCICPWPVEGVLTRIEHSGHVQEMEEWTLPSCAACCGKTKAHTLDEGCVSPRKDGLRLRRTLFRCTRLECRHPAPVVSWHRSQECYTDMAAVCNDFASK